MNIRDAGDPGPLVGRSQPGGGEVRLHESSVRRHTLILGGSGVGKTALRQARSGPPAASEGRGPG